MDIPLVAMVERLVACVVFSLTLDEPVLSQICIALYVQIH